MAKHKHITTFALAAVASLAVQFGVWYVLATAGPTLPAHLPAATPVAIIFGSPVAVASISFALWLASISERSLSHYVLAGAGAIAVVVFSLFGLLPVGCAVQPTNCL
jgi:hypothetical protein